MKYWFTSDEHYFHANVINFNERPFKSINEMDRVLIDNHNEVVDDKDTVIHGGDFALGATSRVLDVIDALNGNHIFLHGSHDRWMRGTDLDYGYIFERNIEGVYVVVCHYNMRTWPRSHYGSIQLFGHSHGKLKPRANQYDIGVDDNDFYPCSFKDIRRRLMVDISKRY